MAESFPMNGGDGTYSYSRNSNYQRSTLDFLSGVIKDVILEKLDIISTPFRIVDFGCSVGPNTFFAVENVIEAVQQKCTSKNIEFQVFFNDHYTNDFNTLVNSLPSERQYYATIAPGSFYDRLLPSGSINVAFSSNSVHWLSREPEGLANTKNEGRIHYTSSSEAVGDAYTRQFEKDMGVFLSARAQEIVTGGLMVLIMAGFGEGIPHSKYFLGAILGFFGSLLMEMASKGEIDKAKVDSFNMPIYIPRIGEVKNVIEKNGYFNIERIELSDLKVKLDGLISAQSILMNIRSGTEGIFTKHFGKEAMEKMFEMAFERTQEISTILDIAKSNATQLFVVLKRR